MQILIKIFLSILLAISINSICYGDEVIVIGQPLICGTEYTVTTAQIGGNHGSESCVSPVCSGSSTTCTITPNDYFTVSVDSDVCDGSWSAPTYTTGVITGNCIVTATYSADCTTYPVLDLFTGANGTELSTHSPDCGSGTWAENTAENASELQITNNRVHPVTTDNSYSSYYISNTPTDADYTVKADAYCVTVSTSPRSDAALVARSSTDARTYYRGRLRGDNVCEVTRVVAGSATVLNSTSTCIAGDLQASTNYALELIVSGTGSTVTVTFKVNGTTKATAGDTNASRITTVGKGGTWTLNGSSSTGFHMDNFQLVN